MAWTDERIDQLKAMWEKGMTASQIADELGGVSRNAVIGKAHRLGLQARPSPVRDGKEESPAVAPAPVEARIEAARPVAPRPVQAERPAPVDPLDRPWRFPASGARRDLRTDPAGAAAPARASASQRGNGRKDQPSRSE
jgi:GcrA cell cycle regulator